VKIQGDSQVLDLPVVDVEGRRVGRVAAVDCAPDPYTAVWFVLRLHGWRRQLRAVPAQHAQWGTGAELQVPYRREQGYASPVLSEARVGTAGSDADPAVFYASVPA
jgi:hypothetical protein